MKKLNNFLNINNKIDYFKKLGIRIPDRDTTLKMLLEEEQIRMSSKYIDDCDKLANKPNGWLELSEQIQYSIVQKYGFNSTIEQELAIIKMRSASTTYKNDPEFTNISVYVRNNLARNGEYKIGDVVPNILIYQQNLIAIQLFDIFDHNKRNLLITGSAT